MKIHFTKMQGLGNDFIVVNGIRFALPHNKKLFRELCHRRLGIGADQILILKKSRRADFKMEIFNADGGQVEMCGNGIRCLAKYLKDEKISAKTNLSIETLGGIQRVRLQGRNRAAVDMGEPILKGKHIPVNLAGRVINRPIRVEGKIYRVTCVSMGNPHCVIFVDELKDYPVTIVGPSIEHQNLFPRRTNVEFVKVIDSGLIEMRVWERGAGETLACGSGACAAMVASVLNHLTDRKVRVKLTGGFLNIEWRRDDGHVVMAGPAETVFQGEIEI